MKKIYIVPELLIVKLGTCKMMAESFVIDDSSENMIEDESDILSKEHKGIWDSEW